MPWIESLTIFTPVTPLATLIAAWLVSTAVMLLFWIVTLLALIEISPLTFSPL